MLDCTLIIPIHNGHEYFLRSLEYYQNTNINVIYIDSTEKEYAFESIDSIRYFHTPELSFQEKILFALQHCETSCVACCAVDDFMSINALSQGLVSMAEDVNIVACVGHYKSFTKPFNGIFYPLYGTPPKWSYHSGQKVQNVKSYIENYHMILWGLYKKSILIEAYKAVSDVLSHVQNDNFIEFMLASVLAYHGKIKYINTIWGYREIAQDTWGGKTPNILQSASDDLISVRNVLDQVTEEGVFDVAFGAYRSFVDDLTSYMARAKRIALRLSARCLSQLGMNKVDKEIKSLLIKYQDLK